MRELIKLKQQANYESVDPSKLVEWLVETDKDLVQYSYGLLKGGADKNLVRFLHEDHLRSDCCIANGIHRMKIIEAAKSELAHFLWSFGFCPRGGYSL